MQVTNVTYDPDIGLLEIRLVDGSAYIITQPAHAALVESKISPGGTITEDQYGWLQRYRAEVRYENRERLRSRLAEMRRELRDS